MNKLLNINGSMTEFAESIERKMQSAFESEAGRKYCVRGGEKRIGELSFR